MTYVVSQTYLPLDTAVGHAGAFYFYAVVSALSGVWIYFFIFETKGRTLEEIQELLKGNKVGAADGTDEGEELAGTPNIYK
jgi:hypothetical protein